MSSEESTVRKSSSSRLYACFVSFAVICSEIYYCNDPKFLDRYAWANSADPDQTALHWIYTVCHSVCIVWTHYSMVEPHSSNFRMITTIFWGVRIFSKFTVNNFIITFAFTVGCDRCC